VKKTINCDYSQKIVRLIIKKKNVSIPSPTIKIKLKLSF